VKQLKVLFSLCGDCSKASSRVRGFWIAEELEQSDVRCSLRWKNDRWDLLLFAKEILRNDVIVFQKNYSRYHRWLMQLANVLGKHTFLDLDDSPSKTRSKRTLKNVEAMMRMADGVFVGSRNLLDYATRHQPKSYLIPSSIKLNNYRPLKKTSQATGEVCLGWIGNGRHYKTDLIAILREPLRAVAEQNPIRFKLIGACREKELYAAFEGIQGLKLDFANEIDWANSSEVSQSLQDIDIGLYPLLSNEFNRYKCGFKALEYMAMQIPVVSSDVAGNRDIIQHGVDGFLVNTKEEWVSVLKQLIDDADRRLRMGKAGRERVKESYNIEKTAALIKSIILKS